ncbi:MAG: iron-sulfur cluster assembly scaffold protein [Proteobacteria bacterium]|nr:iron-sulfur cluster assembly scaffold protein [Pseudomonadota bacterium]
MTGAGAYSAEVLRLFATTPGAGVPVGPDWRRGEASEPLSATRVEVYLRAEAGRVADCRYRVRGCPHTIAALATVAARLPGSSLADLALDVRALAAELGIPPEKLGRLFVIQDAVRAAALQLAPADP